MVSNACRDTGSGVFVAAYGCCADLKVVSSLNIATDGIMQQQQRNDESFVHPAFISKYHAVGFRSTGLW